MAPASAVWMAMALLTLMQQLSQISGADLGVNYGTKGSYLPCPSQVINFLTNNMSYAIPLVRIYEPDTEILEALKGTNLIVSMAVPDPEIPQIAWDDNYASTWVNTNIQPYSDIRFRYIIVGSESIPGPNAGLVLQAMRRLRDALAPFGLLDHVVITTAVSAAVLINSYPPSAGQFSPEYVGLLGPIVQFLYDTKAPLIIHVYPYFALASDPEHISLDYALFKPETPILDGTYRYFSLFEAMVDAFAYATEKVTGAMDVKIVVGETGWPTAGISPFANMGNAYTYNNNLKALVKSDRGTPRRPDLNLETYIFELFNENLKESLDDQNFGTFYPNFDHVYKLWP
ncbi:hypothetical protein Nepgr_031102 [Nepenthes gracilis]|uniref:Glucan endo-1,3-beta-D-glucosidase n=1 Tax=Nepenthes gracilis TaxID=150966 RepID=A0AAD3THG3_NEPGR|nr:hypothetical protein Nepgr_031102 [Nepenthes gracilis]